MGKVPLTKHAEQARRGQWRLPDLPWDEPVKFSGSSRRERLLCKFDLIEVCDALYHFKLGARSRMGDMHVRTWHESEQVSECMEWIDTDDLRHLGALRKLRTTLQKAGREGPESEPRSEPKRMWNVNGRPRSSSGADRLALRMLVDKAVTSTLFGSVARGSHVPLVRAVCCNCELDEKRHAAILTDVLEPSLSYVGKVHVLALQAEVIAHIARLQSAFRPYFTSFASVTGTTTEDVATELFRSISHAVSELGPAWVRYPTARVLHAADRSPWMLWLLR